MKDRDQVRARIDSLKEVITFAALIRIDSIAVANLKSYIKILEWVLSDAD